jgi:biotin-dependent carboxylase-like uncharacterized protein
MTKLEVLEPGLFTTIQDEGRPGFRKFGVPVSGAMDQKAYALANEIVGNEKGAAVLELTLKGGRFKFLSSGVIAITGAGMSAVRNGIPIPMHKPIEVKPGDVLKLGHAKRGCRTYLAIQGSIQLDQVMGSYSTYTQGAFGGLEGRMLQKGDILKWNGSSPKVMSREISKEEIPYYSTEVEVRVYEGLECDWLNEEARNEFLGTVFRVGQSSNRMGIRLEGNKLSPPSKEMISSPVIPGIIQLPPSGYPIILMNDGQTVGGYPRIAKVPDVELWRLGQLKPGDKVRFKLTRSDY